MASDDHGITEVHDSRRERELWHALELGQARGGVDTAGVRTDNNQEPPRTDSDAAQRAYDAQAQAHHASTKSDSTVASEYSLKSPDVLQHHGPFGDVYEMHERAPNYKRAARRISRAVMLGNFKRDSSTSSQEPFGGTGDDKKPKRPAFTTRVTYADECDDTTKFNNWSERVRARHPRTGRVLLYLRGPSPAVVQLEVKPILPKVEAWFDRRLEAVRRRRRVITPLFLLAWLLGFIFLVRASFWTSSTNVGTPTFIVADTSYWYRNDDCGMNGTACMPFSNYSFVFRCPSQTLSVELLNNRAVGDKELVFQPLVVGGMDERATYRADSWICASAIHHGLFDDRKGGCGELELVGEFTDFKGGKKNGVDSVGFESTFPSSYRFVDTVSQAGCQDLRDEILGFNVAMTTVFSFFIRPAPQAFFWTLLCLGFWHIVIVSDPSSMPPDISTGFGNFLPALFVGESFWRHSWRWVTPAFETAILERTIWYLAGFWFGTLFNISLSWVPLQRLTAADISKQPGGLVAVILLVLFLAACIVNQLRVIRRTGWFFFYLKWYAVGGAVLAVLGTALPGLEFRLHHYIAAIALVPGCAFVTRPSAIFQGFLLGMFLNGVGRWGFDSILQTSEELAGDAALGSALPEWVTSAANFTRDQSTIFWNAIPSKIADQWDGYALLVDDVLRYTGTATNWSTSALERFDPNVPHFFRLAYQNAGSSGDFTKAAIAFFNNGTWVDPSPGPS